MKALLAMLLMMGAVQAGEIEVQIQQMSRLADDRHFQAGGWEGLQLSYQFDESPWYVFGSYEQAGIYAKAKAWDYDFMGIGGGIKYPLTKHISLFGQIGYYFINNSVGYSTERNEGIDYYLNTQYEFVPVQQFYNFDYEYVQFDAYTVENDNAFGGAIGIEMDYPITDNMNFGFTVSYRNMKIKEMIRGYVDEWNYVETGTCWEFGLSRNYSTINYGVSFDYRF